MCIRIITYCRYLHTEAGVDSLRVHKLLRFTAGVDNSSLTAEDASAWRAAPWLLVRTYSGMVLDAPPLNLADASAILLSFTSDGANQPAQGGFYLTYSVVQALSPPPPPPPATPAGPLLCEAITIMLAAGQLQSEGGYITSDLAWRKSTANKVGGSIGSSLSFPPLPEGSPAIWLQRYQPSTNCSWRFDIGSSLTATFSIE